MTLHNCQLGPNWSQRPKVIQNTQYDWSNMLATCFLLNITYSSHSLMALQFIAATESVFNWHLEQKNCYNFSTYIYQGWLIPMPRCPRCNFSIGWLYFRKIRNKYVVPISTHSSSRFFLQDWHLPWTIHMPSSKSPNRYLYHSYLRLFNEDKYRNGFVQDPNSLDPFKPLFM